MNSTSVYAGKRIIFEEKKPRINTFWPEWCHGHCTKMDVEKLDIANQMLILRASAAEVKIIKAVKLFPQYPQLTGWFVEWEVVLLRFTDLAVRGRTQFSDEDLSSAFGLTDDSNVSSGWLIERYGGTSANQAGYIRWKNFLNIPCPGTGHDGDPNVSIEINEARQEAVRQLLNL